MDANTLAGTATQKSNPVKIYHLGWFFLAGTSLVYLLFMAIRIGLGLNFDMASKQSQLKTASIQQHQHRTIANADRGPVSTKKQALMPVRTAMVHNAQQKILALTKRQPRQNLMHNNNQHMSNKIVRKAALHINPRQLRNKTTGSIPQRQNTATATKAVMRTPHHQSAPYNNYMINGGYTEGFMHDLPLQRPHSATQARPRKAVRKPIRTSLFGVRLAKGRNVTEVRQYWSRINNKYFKQFQRLGPLVIKENTGDPYPIKLIIGPFKTAEHAVKFCASMKQAFNCNLNKYQGTPL